MQLKLLSAYTLLSLLYSVTALPEAVAEPIEDLMKRDCEYGECRSMLKSDDLWTGKGKYCGFCLQVKPKKKKTHIYQVNGESGKDGCCDYGVNDDCKKWWNKYKDDYPNGYWCDKSDYGY